MSLNAIIFQAVICQNPIQMVTITYDEIKDTFVYRLYRSGDSSIFERQILATEVMRTCAPHLRSMMREGLSY